MDKTRKGTIVAHYGVAVNVRFIDDTTEMIRVKRNSGHVVGDEVEVTGEILKRFPRRTEIARTDARGSLHVVAANLDLLCIVTSCEPLPPPGFLDRAIVSARSAGLSPVLLLNKSDLPCFPEYEALTRQEFAESLPTFSLSALNHENVGQFLEFLAKNHRGILVGPTGVGKSSILNSLIPDLELETGEISSSKKRGRHTTTVSTLHSLPGGGEMIDSPGFNDFGLVDIASDAFAHFFPGFETALQHPCYFRDCKHRQEPGCSVTEALQTGKISPSRYQTYLNILTEIEGIEANAIYRERRKRRKK